MRAGFGEIRAEFEHLVRDRLGATDASEARWNAPRLICIAGDLFGLGTVASVNGAPQTARGARRQTAPRSAAGVRDALLDLGDGVARVERKQYTAFQRLRNFACVCPQRSKLLVHLKVDPKQVDHVCRGGRCVVVVLDSAARLPSYGQMVAVGHQCSA
ncbi:hypothetical protein [Streptomyces sp. LaPpAH-108]|uniref:hypothetical protein n=1 Tax=Streptomyces sp. LaPpAH-108 TaxID=1155714 RepID=UPI00036063E5|nr:hypothetical protein [Streptomyces sp. LaPpAH-108]